MSAGIGSWPIVGGKDKHKIEAKGFCATKQSNSFRKLVLSHRKQLEQESASSSSSSVSSKLQCGCATMAFSPALFIYYWQGGGFSPWSPPGWVVMAIAFSNLSILFHSLVFIHSFIYFAASVFDVVVVVVVVPPDLTSSGHSICILRLSIA